MDPHLTMPRTLTREEKIRLYEDGYVVLKNVVSQNLVHSALDAIDNPTKDKSLATETRLTDLINLSDITPVLHEALGYFDPPIACQPGLIRPRPVGDYFNNVGYRDKDMPYFGANVHVDGSCTISVPQDVQEGTPAEIYRKYVASGPNGDLGRSPDVIGHNSVPLFMDPEMTLGLGSFTAFVFICLNDQTREGCGQTALLKGAHHAVERFFRYQRDANNHLGVEGPGWPRLDHSAPNRCGLVYTPDAVKDVFIDDSSECTPDGRPWPRPTQILMEPGDACITVYQVPHSGTRNELGTETRKTIIFRIRNKSRQPDKMVNGITDHADRGQRGEWIEYEEGNNPWERSKHAMCNMWHEWEGMHDLVNELDGVEASVG